MKRRGVFSCLLSNEHRLQRHQALAVPLVRQTLNAKQRRDNKISVTRTLKTIMPMISSANNAAKVQKSFSYHLIKPIFLHDNDKSSNFATKLEM